MIEDKLEQQLRRLILGLADQEIVRGGQFHYDGGLLHADDVAEMALPSILCIAQSISERTGLGGFGYEFALGEPSPVFPLKGHCVSPGVAFSAVAPFVSEVFHNEVLDCKKDMALLFESAAQLVRDDFQLSVNTTYTVTEAVPRTHSAVPLPGVGRELD